MRGRLSQLAVAASLLSATLGAAGALPGVGRASATQGVITCAQDVIFIGVRESGAPAGFGDATILTVRALQQGLSGKRTVDAQWLDYPALSVPAIFQTWPPGADYLNSVQNGVDTLKAEISLITSHCNSWVAVAGYSQGALVIRRALAELPTSQTRRVAGIALFGDPARHDAGDGLDHFGGAQGSGRNGIYETTTGQRVAASPRGRGLAASWCVPDDAVCDFTAANLVRDVRLGDPAANHAKYKSNGSPTTAGYWMAEDILKLPSRPDPVAPTTGTVPPVLPAGNFVSTCSLAGVDHCAGVNLRSRPIFPGNVVGVLPELTGVTVVCASQGSLISDSLGSSTWWAYIRSGAQAGYVSYLFVEGGFDAPPRCGPSLAPAGSSDLTGAFRQFGSANYSFPVYNDAALAITVREVSVSVVDPSGHTSSAPCAGGSVVTLQPSESWTCLASSSFTMRGSYTATLRWTDGDGHITDGTPYWDHAWEWNFAVSDGPLQGVETKMSGQALFRGSTVDLTSTVSNVVSATVSYAQLGHLVMNPDGTRTMVPCATNVTLSPGQAFTCMSHVQFPQEGRYGAWFAYRLSDGTLFEGPRLFTPDWSFTISPLPVTEALKVSGYSLTTAATTDSSIRAQFTVTNTGTLSASFYPLLLSDPFIYGGFGECKGINYAPEFAEIATYAVTLQPGGSYTCVMDETLPPDSVGPHLLYVYLLTVEGGSLTTSVRVNLDTINVTERPPDSVFVDQPPPEPAVPEETVQPDRPALATLPPSATVPPPSATIPPPSANPPGSGYSSLVPMRFLDSRPGGLTVDGAMGGIGVRLAGSVTELQVAGRAGIPADASAVVLNITVTEAQEPGFVTAYPCGSERPTGSNLNYVAGSTIPNAVVARVGAGGKVCLYTYGATHLIADINGYFPDQP
jgi:hypothetical protein